MPLRFLVSAGPTREYLDPVRFLSNPSSGKMGFAVAEAALERGHSCVLVSGPVSLTPPKGATYIPIVSAEDMLREIEREFSTCDVLVMTAAVSDFKPKTRLEHKEHKLSDSSVLELVRTPDILQTLYPKKEEQLVIGFAAETYDLEASAARKMFVKGLDMIVANDVSSSRAGFAVEKLDATFLFPEYPPERLGLIDKQAVAKKIVEFAERLKTL